LNYQRLFLHACRRCAKDNHPVPISGVGSLVVRHIEMLYGKLTTERLQSLESQFASGVLFVPMSTTCAGFDFFIICEVSASDTKINLTPTPVKRRSGRIALMDITNTSHTTASAPSSSSSSIKSSSALKRVVIWFLNTTINKKHKHDASHFNHVIQVVQNSGLFSIVECGAMFVLPIEYQQHRLVVAATRKPKSSNRPSALVQSTKWSGPLQVYSNAEVTSSGTGIFVASASSKVSKSPAVTSTQVALNLSSEEKQAEAEPESLVDEALSDGEPMEFDREIIPDFVVEVDEADENLD
jgi:hypothetical protein